MSEKLIKTDIKDSAPKGEIKRACESYQRGCPGSNSSPSPKNYSPAQIEKATKIKRK